MLDHNQDEYPSHPHVEVDLLTKLNAAISLSKKLPPSKLKKNLIGLINLAPQIQDNLLEKIQLPMEIDHTNKDWPFLKTQFNREGNSYRNPHTNHYSPENLQGYCPSGIYRSLQQLGESLFGEYVKQYYGNDTVGNFYVMENDSSHGTFSCGFFAKKISKEQDDFEGAWDSFNIVDISPDQNGFIYNLNSTILIEMGISNKGINLTGFLKKSKQQKRSYKMTNQQQLFDNHLSTIGDMIEEMQTSLRQHLQSIYVAKTKQIIFTTRYQNTIQEQKQRMSLAQNLKNLRFDTHS